MVLDLHYVGKVNKNNPMAEETGELVSSVTKFYSFFTVQNCVFVDFIVTFAS